MEKTQTPELVVPSENTVTENQIKTLTDSIATYIRKFKDFLPENFFETVLRDKEIFSQKFTFDLIQSSQAENGFRIRILNDTQIQYDISVAEFIRLSFGKALQKNELWLRKVYELLPVVEKKDKVKIFLFQTEQSPKNNIENEFLIRRLRPANPYEHFAVMSLENTLKKSLTVSLWRNEASGVLYESLYRYQSVIQDHYDDLYGFVFSEITSNNKNTYPEDCWFVGVRD